MIEALEIEDPTRTCIPWPKVAWLQERVEFSPGLNILFAPNGSGKSTVLTTIACCVVSKGIDRWSLKPLCGSSIRAC